MALRLRWWDDLLWTTHTRPKPVVEHRATEHAIAQAASGAVPAAGSMVIAEPHADEPHSRSVPHSWSPGSAGLESASTRLSPVVDTPGSAPIVTVIARGIAVVLTGFESTPWIWIVGAALIPVLWIIMWVRRDRISLHEWGHGAAHTGRGPSSARSVA